MHVTEAQYRAIIDTAVDSIIVIDEQGLIRSFNRAAETVFGYPAEEVVGCNVMMLMPEPYHSRHDRYLEAYRATGQRKIIGIGREVVGQRRDGTVFPMDLSIAEWREEGERFFTAIVRDITERKATETALQIARDHAVAANMAKTKFLAAASHDLRQPLQSLFFFADGLRRHVDAGPGRDNLLHLERGLDAMKELLESLLDVSRLDAGRIQVATADFILDDLIRHIGTSFTPIAEGKGLSFFVAPCPVAVRSDRTLLSRILRNLVENAVRYTEKGGISLSCHFAAADREIMRIVITDSGPGIADDHLIHIFDEFYQVGNFERDREQGLGLGLTIVNRLAGLLGHKVFVTSVVGLGTTFTIDVPLGTMPPLAPPVEITAETPGVGRFAVVIDDDAIVLLGLQTMLVEFGYEVLIAGSTDEAVRKLKKHGRRPDIVIVDYRLRDGRIGTEAILVLREMFDNDLPGVILTGELGPEPQHDAAANDFGLIFKPVTARQLTAAIDMRCEGARNA